MRLMTGHVTTEFRFDRLDGSLCIGIVLLVMSEEVVHFFSFQQTLYVFGTYFVTPFLYLFSTSWVSVLCGRTFAERTWFLVLSSSGAKTCARHGKRRRWPIKSIRTRRCCLLRMILSPRYRHPIDNRWMELSLSVCGTCDRSVGVIWTFPGCPTIFWSWSFPKCIFLLCVQPCTIFLRRPTNPDVVGRSRSFPNILDTSYSFVPGSSRNAWIISYFHCGFW